MPTGAASLGRPELAPGARADELVSYDDGEGSTIREGTRQRRQSEKEKAINSRLQTKNIYTKKGGAYGSHMYFFLQPEGVPEGGGRILNWPEGRANFKLDR